MPKIKLTTSWPSLDRVGFERDYMKLVHAAFIKAARKFLLAAMPKVPVFTGFARGAFDNLEAIAGRVERLTTPLFDGGAYPPQINSARGPRKKVIYYQKRKYYYYPPGGSKVVRTNLSGRPFATPTKDIMTPGRITSASVGSRLVFFFHIDITYFDRLDESMWQSFKAGKVAFENELKVQLAKLPIELKDYVISRR
jgi:hypothetical protein